MDCKRTGLVHMAAKAVGMDEDAYRDFLKSRVGVSSAKDLNPASFRTLMEEFKRLGWKSRPGPRTIYQERLEHWRRQGLRAGMATAEQLGLIEELAERVFRAQDKTKALRTFLFKRFKISDLRFLDAEVAAKVINALRAMARRR